MKSRSVMRGGGGAFGVDRAIALASRVANDRNFHLYPKVYPKVRVFMTEDRDFGCSTSSLPVLCDTETKKQSNAAPAFRAVQEGLSALERRFFARHGRDTS
jgi:hypothetical protein